MCKFILKLSFVISMFWFITSNANAALAKSDTNIADIQQTLLKQQRQLAEQAMQIKQLQKQLAINSTTKRDLTHTGFVIAERPAKITFSGQVNHAMLFSDDGRNSKLFFVMNENSPTVARLIGMIQANHDTAVGSQIELGFKVNPSGTVSQSEPSPAALIDSRRVELFVDSKRFGKIWLGKGSTASDNTAETDLSGTSVAHYSGPSSFGGGLYFRSPNDDATYTNNPQVLSVFNNLDGLSRKNRVRYDSPLFFGFSLAASIVEGNKQDIAISFANDIRDTKIAGSIAYATGNLTTNVSGKNLDGSLSILLANGFSVTGAAGEILAQAAARRNPFYYYTKLGYQKSFFQLGKTAFSVDLGKFNNFAQNYDKGTAYGVGIVQNITDWNFAVYANYRLFKLDNSAAAFNRINVVGFGAIFKF